MVVKKKSISSISHWEKPLARFPVQIFRFRLHGVVQCANTRTLL